jgi:hypothetical protein
MPDPNHETLQRVRRIETRLTQTMVALGIDTNSQKPEFWQETPGSEARIALPSPHTSLKELVLALPDGWTGPVRLYIGDDSIGTFTPDRS